MSQGKTNVGQVIANRGLAVTFAGMGINLALGILYAWSVISKGIPESWNWSEADKSWPYAIACIVRGLKFDDSKIKEVIDIQEKLGATMMRNRKKGGRPFYRYLAHDIGGMRSQDVRHHKLHWPGYRRCYQTRFDNPARYPGGLQAGSRGYKWDHCLYPCGGPCCE